MSEPAESDPGVTEWFWAIIEAAARRAENLRAQLWTLAEEDVARFHEEFVRAASVLRGEPFDRILENCSEDELMDVAYWVVAQGRAFYDQVLAAPERIPRAVRPGDPALMHHVTVEVFDERFGKALDFF